MPLNFHFLSKLILLEAFQLRYTLLVHRRQRIIFYMTITCFVC